MPNAPTQVGSGRRIFSGTSYVTLSDIDANATVMDVLEQFLAQNSLSQEGAGNNYVERMGPTGNMIGEFDCGSGSGWSILFELHRTILKALCPMLVQRTIAFLTVCISTGIHSSIWHGLWIFYV